MKSCTKIFVILTFFLKLIYCQAEVPSKGTCAANTLKNDPSLLSNLRGVLYTLYTSKLYENNEVFDFEPIDAEGFIHVRTTNAAGCCKTMYLNAIAEGNGNHFEYVIATDETCPTPLTENACIKLLAVNKTSGQTCLMVWTCRASREGVHAFCTRKELSNPQKKWIQQQYKTYGLIGQTVKQDKDLSKGKCFVKK